MRAEACRLPNAQVWAGRSFNVEGTKTEGSQLLLLDLLHNYLLDGWYHGSQLGHNLNVLPHKPTRSGKLLAPALHTFHSH